MDMVQWIAGFNNMALAAAANEDMSGCPQVFIYFSYEACALTGLDVHGFNGTLEDLHGDSRLAG